MNKVYRVFVEKRKDFATHANETFNNLTEELKIRPAAYLDGKLNVSGKGTLDDPLKLSRGDTNEN